MKSDLAATNPDPARCTTLSRSEIIEELDRVIRLTLSKKKALRKMLQFIVEATLDGKSDGLKEYTIATLVFGKAETFDPRMTSLVRTQASKLRVALSNHYASYPRAKAPWLWVPAGSYRAVFDQNPSGNAKTGNFGSSTLNEAQLAPLLRIAQPNVLASRGDVHDIAHAVSRLQRENFTTCNWLVRLAEPNADSSTANPHDTVFEVGQTLVESDGRILLTAFITAGAPRLVVFATSISIPWNGDSEKAIANLSVPLAQFASACSSLVSFRASGPTPFVSCGPGPVRWEESGALEVPLIPQRFSTDHNPRSRV